MLTALSWLLAALACLALSPAWAQEFEPAQFGTHALSVTNTLGVPQDRPAGAYDAILTCQVIVEADGSTMTPSCIADRRYEAFRSEVIRVLSGSVMRPASIDGQPVRALMALTAAFRCLDACTVSLVPNHTRHIEALGTDYSSPQPVLETGTWYTSFDRKLAWASSNRPHEQVGGIKFVVSTRIDATGQSSRRRVVQRAPDFWSAATRAASTLDDVRYIPAFHNGEPVELQLYEYWIDPAGSYPEAISVPVRVHMLQSSNAEALDTTLTDTQLDDFLERSNAHWRPAGIRWDIESVVRIQAEDSSSFERLAAQGEDAALHELHNELSALCSAAQQLEPGWNLCLVHESPWGPMRLEPGLIVMAEPDPTIEPVYATALAQILGESLGIQAAPACTGSVLHRSEDPGSSPVGACLTTQLNDEQIAAARTQAARGRPWGVFRLPPIRPTYWSHRHHAPGPAGGYRRGPSAQRRNR